MLFRTIIVSSALLLADGARIKMNNDQVKMNNDQDKISETGGECPRTVAEPPNQESLQEYFDQQRVKLGLLDQSVFDNAKADLSNGSPEQCTKRDVCLLMRQLDMDFYQRARAGTLTDMDFDTKPELSWVESGNCVSAAQKRGKRYKTVTDAKKCKAATRKTAFSRASAPKNIDSDEYPAGCIVVVDNNKGTKRAYINRNTESAAEAGHKVSTDDTSMSRRKKDLNVHQLCEQDRSLSESAATYYSPYKLKQSMKLRAKMSTSCSFGMYAYLAKLTETKSSCAKLLTFKTSSKIKSASQALQIAKKARALGRDELANELESYVKDVKTKYVLIDTIANKWCPSVWSEAMKSRGTCDVPRMSSWAEEVQEAQKEVQEAQSKPTPTGGRMGAAGLKETSGNADSLSRLDDMLAAFMEEDDSLASLLAGDVEVDEDAEVQATSNDGGKPAKMALSDDFCAGMEDETLASILDTSPDTPPDFFRFVDGVADGSHPGLGAGTKDSKFIK